MRWFPFALMLCLPSITTLAAPKSVTELTGSVCVIDGNTMKINSVRRRGRCVGGVSVRLFGADAPDLKQNCQFFDGRVWHCGRAAAANLLKLVNKREIRCQGTEKDGEGRIIAVCWRDSMNIGREMVRFGWSMADKSEKTYQSFEKDAHLAGQGLWQGKFEEPSEWRLQQNYH